VRDVSTSLDMTITEPLRKRAEAPILRMLELSR